MDKLRIVIVEDEFAIAEDLRCSFEDNGYEVAGVFDRAIPAIAFIESVGTDILLVDIRLMGEMDGIDMVKQLQLKRKMPVIYITANREISTYERAKGTYPQAFLMKPFDHESLLTAVDLAILNYSSLNEPREGDRQPTSHVNAALVNECLFVRVNGKYKKVKLDELLYVEASGSYVMIITSSDRYTLAENLTQFQKKSPLPDMVRIHRSYIVNIKKVDYFEDSFVFVQNHKLPLSDSYKENFLNHIHLL